MTGLAEDRPSALARPARAHWKPKSIANAGFRRVNRAVRPFNQRLDMLETADVKDDLAKTLR